MYLIINVGSTSVKTCLFNNDLHLLALMSAEYGAERSLCISGQDFQGHAIKRQTIVGGNAETALAEVLTEWRNRITSEGVSIVGIGHRIVHGGSSFDAITLITRELLTDIAMLDGYAPLHNPQNRLGVKMAAQIFPEVLHYAVFDTAFHRRIPEYAGRYAIPSKLSRNVDFYRYGFHGISCQHSLSAAAKLLNKDAATLKLIVLHLGGGASVTAVNGGVSIDTSMGFSPTEGLIMSGRSGDLDPMISLTLQKEGWSAEKIDRLLNHESGLMGICGTSDMRTVLVRAEQGDNAALLAIDMYCYRVKKYIGAYCAVLGNVTALIFTGGIGEHAPRIREKIVGGLDGLGFSIDSAENYRQEEVNRDIGTSASRSRILVIKAEEEHEIARQILEFTNQQISR